MELSGIDLARVVAELNAALNDYYVNSIGSVDDVTWLIRLHHSTNPEKRLIISLNKGIWLTSYEVPTKPPDAFSAHLREYLLRGRFLKVEQPDVERLVKIWFTVNGLGRVLVAEFFGGGNLLVLDAEERILTLFRKIDVRHRRLAQGLQYVPPPPRGKNPFTAHEDILKDVASSDLEIARYLGRELALSRKYVEEVLRRADIDPKARSLNKEQSVKLRDALINLKDLIFGAESKPTILLKDGKPIDASPFKLTSYSVEDYRHTDSFIEAVDEVQTLSLLEELKKKEEEPTQRRIEELNRALEAQAKSRLELEKQAKKLREIATALRSAASESKDLPTILTTLGVEYTQSKGDYIEVKEFTEPIKIPKTSSTVSAASVIFDAAKVLESKIRAIKEAEKSLFEKKALLLTKAAKEETKPLKRIRVKKWFERYRWFYTSKGLLAVGGRDAASNTVILRRYLQEDDIVFHADIHGSPFFILKGGAEANEESIRECCEAVAAYSSAWKAELTAVDVYWIKPNQIKFTGPSGTYLPKGAFLIEGAKNWVKNVKVYAGVGLTILDEEIVVVGGPPSALKANSIAYATLVPEKGKVSETAKRVKSGLIAAVGRELGLRVKEIPLDDFIRALPNGGGKVTSINLGEQKS
ncbi:MAG: ribosome rescue protein RqcH [Nitrososphaerales archaeon]